MSILGYGASFGQMSGSYTVGGSLPDFADIQEACDSIMSLGLNGAVTIEIRNGTYNETVVLDSAPGISMTNSLTFKSENNDSSLVIIAGGTGTAFEAHVPYLTFEHLSFTGTSNSNALELYNTGNLTIESCTFWNDSTMCCNDAVLINNWLQGPKEDLENIVIQNSFWSGSAGLSILSDYGDIRNVRIENCEGASRNSNTLYMYANQTLEKVEITDCDFLCLTRDAVYLEGYTFTDSIDFNNCTVDAYDEAFYVYSDGTTQNVRVADCDFKGLAPLGSTSNYAIDIEGYYTSLVNVDISNVTIDSFVYGVYMYSDYTTQNISMSNMTMTNINSTGFDIEGYYLKYKDISFDNIDLSGNLSSEGIYTYSDALGRNISITNSTIDSENGYALYLEASGMLKNVDIVGSTIDSDTNCCSYSYLYSGDNSVEEVTLSNSDFTGYEALYIDADANVYNVDIENCTFWGKDYGLDIYASAGNVGTVDIRNSDIWARGDDALYIYSSSANVEDVNLDSLDIESIDGTGAYLYADGRFYQIDFTNSTVKGENDYGIEMYAYTGGDQMITFDNLDVTGWYDAFYYDHDYGYIRDWWITNSTFTSLDGDYYGIYFEGDDCELRRITIEDNMIVAGYGMYLEGDYGGIHETWIRNNDIRLESSSGYGIEMYETGSGVTIENNTIDTINGNSSYDSGFYIDCEYNLTDSLMVMNNNVWNYNNYGLYTQYSLENVHVEGNVFHGDPAGSYEGILIYEAGGYEMVIDRNEVYGYGEGSYAIDIEYLSMDPGTRAMFSNNMVSGYDQSIYLYSASNLDIVHNTINVLDDDNDVCYIDWNSLGLKICNNIFNTDSSIYTGDVFYFIDQAPVMMMDNNTVNIDTNSADYAYNDWWGYTYNSLKEWNDSTGFDGNSFYRDVVFEDDSTNLHLKCSETALQAGKPGTGITWDLDGNQRDASMPTIGADELLANGLVLLNDSLTVCTDPITLNAGNTPGATYSWSTGASTNSINVTMPGTYTVAVTDACGTANDTTVVTYESMPTAGFTNTISFLTVTFANSSAGALSYAWDFGDGNTSTDMNPIHIYAMDGSYTVELIAYGECTNDTSTQTVIVSTVGVAGPQNGGTIAIYPNPSAGNLNVSLDGISGTDLSIVVYNLSGQTVAERTLDLNGKLHVEEMDLSTAPKGIYFLSIRGTEVNHTAKVVLE